MGINAPFGSKKEYKLVPAGNHVARVYSIIHLGVIEEEYMGETKEMDKVRISFELPNETEVFKEGEEPKPFSISQEYTLSMGEKANLRKLVEGILGGPVEEQEEGFGVSSLMGKTCLLNVIHRTSKAGNEYAQIASAAPLPKGMEAPTAVNETSYLDFEEGWDQEKFDSLPDFIKDKIKSSKNYKRKFNIPEEELDPSAIPF